MPKKLMKAAKKRNPPWPAPKRGKARSLMKAFPMKRKVPKVSYVRDQKTVMKVDKRKMRWGRPVHMLASTQGRSLLRLLRSDGLLQKWEGKSCPRCGEGSLGDLYLDKEKQVWLHRCNRKGCQFRVRPHDYHPIFFVGSGPKNTSLSLQAAILCCAGAAWHSPKASGKDLHQPGSSAVQICPVDGKKDRLRSGQEMVRCGSRWSGPGKGGDDQGWKWQQEGPMGAMGRPCWKRSSSQFGALPLDTETDRQEGARPWPHHSQRLGTHCCQTLIQQAGDPSHRWCSSLQAKDPWGYPRQCCPQEEACHHQGQSQMDQTTLYEDLQTQTTWWKTCSSEGWHSNHRSLLGSFETKSEAHLPKARERFVAKKNPFFAVDILEQRERLVESDRMYASSLIQLLVQMHRKCFAVQENIGSDSSYALDMQKVWCTSCTFLSAEDVVVHVLYHLYLLHEPKTKTQQPSVSFETKHHDLIQVVCICFTNQNQNTTTVCILWKKHTTVWFQCPFPSVSASLANCKHNGSNNLKSHLWHHYFPHISQPNCMHHF